MLFSINNSRVIINEIPSKDIKLLIAVDYHLKNWNKFAKILCILDN